MMLWQKIVRLGICRSGSYTKQGRMSLLSRAVLFPSSRFASWQIKRFSKAAVSKLQLRKWINWKRLLKK